MRFSIIVPIYNMSAFLPEMLESAFAQTDAHDFELVLVDDGSTDKSPAICDECASLHRNVRVVHKPNGGLISARREGLKAAAGDYVLFCDADDMLRSNALASVSRIIDEASPDVIIYNAYIYDGGNRTVFFEHELPEGPVEDKRLIYDKLFMSYSMNSMCLKAMRREIIDTDRDYSAFYGCTVAEDMLQSAPVIKNAKSIYYLDKALYDYRMDSGMTHKCNPDYYRSNLQINLDVRRQLKDEGITDLEQKASFHLLIAAYAGITQMKYSEGFDRSLPDSIRNDEHFRNAWDICMGSPYAASFSFRQKLILRLLHSGNYKIIHLLLKIRGSR